MAMAICSQPIATFRRKDSAFIAFCASIAAFAVAAEELCAVDAASFDFAISISKKIGKKLTPLQLGVSGASQNSLCCIEGRGKSLRDVVLTVKSGV